MWELHDNFEIFGKINFYGEEFSKIDGQFPKFQQTFNRKTVLSSLHKGESIEQSERVAVKVSPLPSLLKVRESGHKMASKSVVLL